MKIELEILDDVSVAGQLAGMSIVSVQGLEGGPAVLVVAKQPVVQLADVVYLAMQTIADMKNHAVDVTEKVKVARDN